MHGRLWRNPIYSTIFIKYLLVQPVNFKSERYDETWILTLRTRQISNLLSSMLLKISAFQCAVYAINVTITNAFPPKSSETPVQHKLFQYNMTYDKITPHFTNRSASIIQFYAWFSIISDVGVLSPCTWYGDAKSSCAPGFSGVRRSAAAPDLVSTGGPRWASQVSRASSGRPGAGKTHIHDVTKPLVTYVTAALWCHVVHGCLGDVSNEDLVIIENIQFTNLIE